MSFFHGRRTSVDLCITCVYPLLISITFVASRFSDSCLRDWQLEIFQCCLCCEDESASGLSRIHDILTPFPHSRLDVALRLDLDLCFLPPFLRDILILSLPRNLIYIISSNTKLNESLIWVAVNTFDIHYPFQWPLNLRCSQNKFIWKLSFHRFNRPGEVMIDDSILSATFFTRGDNYPP